MEKEIAEILKEFGAIGLWGVVIYKVLNIVEVIVGFSLIGFGIKKAWPHIKRIMED